MDEPMELQVSTELQTVEEPSSSENTHLLRGRRRIKVSPSLWVDSKLVVPLNALCKLAVSYNEGYMIHISILS